MKARFTLCLLLGLLACGSVQRGPEQDPLLGVGQTDASVDPRAGTQAPVDPTDPASILARAQLLDAMQRALEAGQQSPALADLQAGVVPVVLVDPGLQSAQIRYVRVVERGDDLRRIEAQQMASASLLLEPARILDVQRQVFALEPEDKPQVVALVLAQEALRAAGGAEAYDLFAVPETLGGAIVYRVYARSRRAELLDREVAVAWTPKGRPMVEMLERPSARLTASPDIANLETLHPLAIARLLQRDRRAPFHLRTGQGAFVLSPEGALRRAETP